ncbi:MAG TPA: hypothetical protein P5169_05305, partial [Kiritimatiellia bacterium]|nr:hypothetical protein [Kiritimatiellia bacterium]
MKSNVNPSGSLRRGASAILLLLCFLVTAVVVFHALWAPGAVLMSTDDNVGLLKRTQRVLEASAFHPWEGEALWGLPGISGIRPGFLLLRMIPATLFMNVFHGLCLALAAWLAGEAFPGALSETALAALAYQTLIVACVSYLGW